MKPYIKKTIVALAATALAVGVSSCAAPAEGDAASTDEQLRMVLIQGIKGDEFYVSVACGAQEKADELGIDLEVQAGEKWDATVQTPIVNAAIATGPDAILIASNDTQGMVPTFEQARAQGIALVAFDQIFAEDGVMDAQVASDSVEGGRLAAEELVRQMGETGTVLVVSLTPAIPGGEQRAQGFEDEIAKYPGITLLERQYSNNEPVKAASIVSATLAAHPELTGVFAVNLMSADGAATALKAAGKTGEVLLVAADASPGQVTSLEDGLVQALVAQKPLEEGAVAVQEAYNVITGAPVTPMTTTGWVVVTKENIDDPEVGKYLYKSECN